MRHLAKDLVAGDRAEQIVDGLEAVEIDYGDREGRRIGRALAGQQSNLVAQPVPVAEAGQLIGIGHRLKLVLAHLRQCWSGRAHRRILERILFTHS